MAKTGNSEDIGILRLEFTNAPSSDDAQLEPISWEQFFDKFDERGLALVYQEETAGGAQSNFNKLITSESARSSRSAGSRSAPRKAVAKKKNSGSSLSTARGATSKRRAASTGKRFGAKVGQPRLVKKESSREESIGR